MKETVINDCWNKIGVWSHATEERCPELKTLTHCHNCPVYSNAGRHLLDRTGDEAYRQEWTQNLAKMRVDSQTNSHSIMVFRIGDEWFGLPIEFIREATYCSHHHSVPHRKNNILRGIVNVRGELLPSVSLGNLFRLQKAEKKHSEEKIVHQRYIVISDNNELYTFPVSEVRYTLRYDPDALQKTPSTVAESTHSFIRGVIPHENINIGLIDTELLFHALQRNTA